jgi:hypothetical protein
MAHLDLDAKRAARSEALKQSREIIFGGETFAFPPTMPLECLDLLRGGDVRGAVAFLLDDEKAAARFFAHRPDDLDLEEILDFYGQRQGEVFSGSPTSSMNGGARPKRTSKRSTAST